MSENLDLVRSIYRAWELGDFSSADWADLEIEYVMAEGPAPGNWRGLVEMAKAWGDFLSAWEWYRVEVDRYCELDDQRVLVLVRFSARGKTSGPQRRADADRECDAVPRPRRQGDEARRLLGPRARPQ